MFDQQRVHFARLQSEQAENYFVNLKEVTKATMETNMLLHTHKNDREEKLRQDEILLDHHELHQARQTRQQYVDASDMTRYQMQ